jgi:uncharacterized membrane protein
VIRLVIWSVIGLLLALLVHLTTVLAIPSIATRGAVQRLQSLGGPDSFHMLPRALPGATILPRPDPALRMAACPYDLSNGPLAVHIPVTGAFVSASFYSQDGLNYYALTDRAASNDAIELTIFTTLQLAQARAREGPDTPESLRIEAPGLRGLVIARALAPDPDAMPSIERLLTGASCHLAPATADPGQDPTVSSSQGGSPKG